MDSYPVDVRELRHDLGATLHVDSDVELPTMEFGQSSFEPASPAHATVTVSNTGAGIVAYGTIDVDFHTQCVRCLEPFVLHVTGEVEGFYTTPEHAESLAEEQEWAPITNDTIDLYPALDAAARIELPLAPVHAEDCGGICPVCGANRNVDQCTCTVDEPVPGPFDALKTLLPPSEE